MLWYGYSKFNKGIPGKGCKLQSIVTVKPDKKVPWTWGEPCSLRRNFDNCHHVKAFSIHTRVRCHSEVESYSVITHKTFTESTQRIHSTCDHLYPFCQYKSLLLLGQRLSQSNSMLHVSGDVELQGPKTAEGCDSKNVTPVSLKEAGRAWAGVILLTLGEGCVWKEGKTKQE